MAATAEAFPRTWGDNLGPLYSANSKKLCAVASGNDATNVITENSNNLSSLNSLQNNSEDRAEQLKRSSHILAISFSTSLADRITSPCT
ncbi:hypothetical protein PTTG_11817 [Puccinia triticina 1-1 BBBD Race 1]|uniref:Uncharacterized protein n=1 Tax=Puccinia triticina (isolate 1-1 / race 1 (BBBD)) TaxID=630390 RepID=A0A180GXS9_PUCT1|nr:hypothetical protein PTTG_11817 [Puccinia triticina 1-1 BBBD Race 1]